VYLKSDFNPAAPIYAARLWQLTFPLQSPTRVRALRAREAIWWARRRKQPLVLWVSVKSMEHSRSSAARRQRNWQPRRASQD